MQQLMQFLKNKKNTYLSVKQIQKEINVSLIGSYLIIENFKELLLKINTHQL